MMTKSSAASTPSTLRRRIVPGLTLIIAIAFAPCANANFHVWNITQIYSNASGTLQFIEMVSPTDFQNLFVENSAQITVTNASNVSHTFTLLSDISSATGGKSLLFGTAGIQAAGGPAPDFTLPAGFLFTGGARIDFFGFGGSTNGLTYSALPTDGTHALTYPSGPIVDNSPQNFAGTIGHVVPEPATITLAAIGAICASCFLRRRRG